MDDKLISSSLPKVWNQLILISYPKEFLSLRKYEALNVLDSMSSYNLVDIFLNSGFAPRGL